MTSVTTKPKSLQPQTETAVHINNWFDPIETAIRDRVRGFIKELIHCELETVSARPRYGRRTKSNDDDDDAAGAAGHRHGSRPRTLMGTFGKVEEINVPRASSKGRAARPPSGAARRCAPISAARWPPMR